MKNNNTSVITALNNCADACNRCTTACLEEDDVKMMVNCIKIDIDCAAICTITASLLSRNSPHGKHVLRECIEVCTACANECLKHAHMQHCKDCADACNTCINACKTLLLTNE